MKWKVIGCWMLSLWALGLFTNAQADEQKKDLIERGKYITHSVAMCVQCHTPRKPDGELILSEQFHGAPLPIHSPYPNSQWAFQAPHIAGLPGYTQEEAIRFLMTGITTKGVPPKSPMPPFRMSREDAEAVVAYLKSIK